MDKSEKERVAKSCCRTRIQQLAEEKEANERTMEELKLHMAKTDAKITLIQIEKGALEMYLNTTV